MWIIYEFLFFNLILLFILSLMDKYHAAMITRNIQAVGVRFRLLNSALSMVQGDSFPGSSSQNLLRQRIYATCLDYFTWVLNSIIENSWIFFTKYVYCSKLISYFCLNILIEYFICIISILELLHKFPRRRLCSWSKMWNN